MKKHVLEIMVGIGVLMFAGMVAGAETKYVSAESGLCVREHKSVKSKVLEVLPYGTEVEVGEAKGKWFPCKGGYVSADWLSDSLPMDLLGEWRITAYTHTGYSCANGRYPTAGYTIACNGLAFGTKVYIEGLGIRTVEDRGPTWLGLEWCDVFMDSTSECIQWGDQMRKVWIIDE